MAVSNSFSFLCQNTDGWTEHKADTLSSTAHLHNIDFCFIQEHMRLRKNLYKIQEFFKDYQAFSLPAHKKNSNINRGRPSGGLSILYRKSLEQFITEITIPESNRVQAIHFKKDTEAHVFINVYLPNDPQCANFCDIELLKALQDIQYVFNLYNDSVNFILLGDFNCDFSRNTHFVQTINNFMEGLNLITIWDKFSCDFTYTHPLPNGRCSFSTIDHILVKEEFVDSCIDGSVLHLGENLSRHEILYLKIKPANLIIDKSHPPDSSEPYSKKPKWEKATTEQKEAFLSAFHEKLSAIQIPLNAICCRDLHCSDNSHKYNLDRYAIRVLEALETSVKDHIPHSGTFSKHLPGWNQFIKPLREDMNFWHSVWVSAGRPINTVLHKVYKNVRNQYRYAVRKIKQHKKAMKDNNYLLAAANGKINDILKDLRNQRKPKAYLPNAIDKITDPQEISNHFGSIYNNIYNHHDDTDKIQKILEDLDQKVSADDTHWLSQINSKLIFKIINKLKFKKNDENFKFKSDAFIISSHLLCKPLCMLFKGYLVHGHFTDVFLLSSLVPIVKDGRKSKLNSNNYRLIAVSSLLLKLIDLLVLELFKDNLQVSSLQFGYQSNSSTVLCSWTLRECVNYYANRGSAVYLCLLDLTKAFDRVKLDKLFSKLCDRLPVLFVRLLLYTYINQQCYVKWGQFKSNAFKVSNGVRQGAVASPIFFNLYLDDLFKAINRSHLGCQIGSYNYSILGYADDLSLLSPSREGLQAMVNFVRSYCDEHGIKISVNIDPKQSKTKCIIFNSRLNPANIRLYGISIPFVEYWNHLGTTIQRNERTDQDINKCRGEFIGNIHSLYQELGYVEPNLFLKLVNVYFCSFYGCVLWDLDTIYIHKLYATWNTMIRNAFDLPYGTHRFILQHISKKRHLQEEFYSRFTKFCQHINNSEKEEVLYLYNIQKHDSRSTFGRNFKSVMIDQRDISLPYKIPPESQWKLSLIDEIILIKSRKMNIPGFSSEEVDSMLSSLCCN